MALSQIIKLSCTRCGKPAIEKSRSKFGDTTLITLECGHLMASQNYESAIEDSYNITFSDGKSPRPYQIEAIKFLERAGFNAVVADEQGLGKTIELGSTLILHKSELLPAIIVCPSTVKLQWMKEMQRINNSPLGSKDPDFLIQIITSGKELAIPGMALYIVTFDMLKRPEMFDYVDDIKLLVIDECQRIKNHLSDRAKAVQKIRRKVKYCIPMSGTPIKNNSGEYFTILNLVDSLKFRDWSKFVEKYCDAYSNGWGTKVGGLKDADLFHEDTKDIIIRRKKEEVLTDLPPKERQFHHVELDKKFNKIYQQSIDELEELLYSDESNSFASGAAKIAIMSKLRHITGLSKAPECVEYVTDYLESTDRKLVVFVHHQDVAAMVENGINDWIKSEDGQKYKLDKVLMMHSGLDGNKRSELVAKFKNQSSARIMVASTLAAGEGINLQFCSDAVMLERQWNPANEEQAEDRFHRFGQENHVTIKYFIASETIDEYFTELVEIKRGIISSTMDNKEISWNEQGLMSELAQVLVSRGKKKWSL